MFERFTDRARRVVVLAQEEARIVRGRQLRVDRHWLYRAHRLAERSE